MIISDKRMVFLKEHKYNKKWRNGTMAQRHKGTLPINRDKLYFFFFPLLSIIFTDNLFNKCQEIKFSLRSEVRGRSSNNFTRVGY